ncbi:MAG: hypothetical protein PHU77_14560 [Simplicispira sp.]|nr:hypothetical protein [Simplicispira sp.]
MIPQPPLPPPQVPGARGASGAPGSALFKGRFSGREAFQQLVRDAFAAAAHEGWPEITLSDADFHDWPLGERAVIDSLQAWARSGRRLTMLARRYDEVVRRHARFVRWRGTWEHLLTCRASPGANALDVPSVIWSPQWVLQRIDPERCTGVCGSEPQRRTVLREALGEWIRNKSSPGFPSATLGL